MYKVTGKYGDSVTCYDSDGKKVKKSYSILFNEHIYEPNRELRIGCILGESYELKPKDMTSMNIEFDAVNGNSFAFGCLGCAKLSLGVTYETIVAKYDKLRPYVELKITYRNEKGRDESEWIRVPLGVFLIDEIKSTYLAKNITAYDYAYTMDLGDMTDFPNYNAKPESDEAAKANAGNYFFFELTRDENGKLVPVTTLQNVVDYINNSSDFSDVRIRMGLYETDSNGKYTKPIIDVAGLGLTSYMGIKLYDLGDNFTLRQFIGYLAGLRGRNAIFNRNGKLEFKSIVGRNGLVFGTDLYGSLSEDDTPMVTDAISSQFMVIEEKTAEDGSVSSELIAKPVSYKSWDLAVHEFAFNNPLITNADEDLIKRIYNSITNRTLKWTRLDENGNEVTTSYNVNKYTPCKFRLKGDPRIEINDVITLKRHPRTMTLNEDKTIDVPIMKMKMNLNNTCGLEIESVADSTQGQTSALSGSISKTLANTTSLAKGMFNELYGATGSFGKLFASEGKIGQLMADKVSASELFVHDATLNKTIIKTALIDNLSANMIKGGRLNLSDNLTIGSETDNTIFINGSRIQMESPKYIKVDTGQTDADGNKIYRDEMTNSKVTRVFIGKLSDGSYNFEIKDMYGTPLWNMNGLTAEGLESIGEGGVSGSVIDTLHAMKVLVDKNFSDEGTNGTMEHITLYDYLKFFNGDNVEVIDDKDNKVTLQQYINDSSQSVINIGGNTKRLETKINGVDDRVKELENVTIPAINGVLSTHSGDISSLKEQVSTNTTSINNKITVGDSISDINDKTALGTYIKASKVEGLSDAINSINTLNNTVITKGQLMNEINSSLEKINGSQVRLTPSSTYVYFDGAGNLLTLEEYIDSRITMPEIPDISDKVNKEDIITTINDLETEDKISSDKLDILLTPDTVIKTDEFTQQSLEEYINSKIPESGEGSIPDDGTGETPSQLETDVASLLERVSQLESDNTALKEYNTALEERLLLIESRISTLEGYHTTDPEPEEPIE